MDYFEIHGLKTLNGVVEVSGAKNAVLPLMAASILNQGKLKISNVPTLSDSITMSKLLKKMGADVNFESDNSISVDSSKLDNPFAPYDLVKTMRASFYVLGPLLARFGNKNCGGRPSRKILEISRKNLTEIYVRVVSASSL